MAHIKPFKGVHYNPQAVGDLSRLTAPPYDVISISMQEDYYRAHRNNVIRLILGKVKEDDSASKNRYTRAGKFLKDWQKNGVLLQDKMPAIYIYLQKYLHKGEPKTRFGFIALMKIEDPHKSRVLPHEYTFSKPKKDRLELLKATEANLSPIFMLFNDRNSAITKILKREIRRRPIVDIEQDGVKHRLWRLTKELSIKKISEHMKAKQVFIADGHHRYEVALSYRNLMRRKQGGKEGRRDWDYLMVSFSSLNPEELTVLSTHRVIRSIKGFNAQKAVSMLKECFEVEKLRDKDELLKNLEAAKEGEFLFGVYNKKTGFLLLSLKNVSMLDNIIKQDRSYQWRWLDVTILHKLIFNHILKIKEKVAKKENIIYTREIDHGLRLVDEEGCQIAFFLNPPKIGQIKDVARSRDRMPQKTTYFYPKPLSGLVFYKMENG